MEFCAAFADPIYFKPMKNNREMVFLGCSELELFNQRLIELDDLSALDADQVVMVIGRHGLVAAEFVIEPVFFHKPLFLEGVKGSVNGRKADSWSLGPDQSVNFFGAQVSFRFHKNLQDPEPLLGRMNSVRAKMLGKIHSRCSGPVFE